ncbi:MAG TPA: hypothetical protein VHD63_07215 [Ktedonobacteraceae bacterium]|nr:hypothetical protein [Ktedonobacteraceae bacterium]
MIWLISLGCLVAFIAGIFLLVSIMPRLIKRAVDDALFIGVAAVAIFGAMLAFGSIGVTFAVFSGSIGVRIINAIMLIVLGVVTLRTALGAFRSRSYSNAQSDQRLTRLLVGSFFLLLAVTALALLVLLFIPS